MTIVCATHFSDTSFSPTKVAASFASARREPLFLVHVQSGDTPGAGEAEAFTALSASAAALSSNSLEVKAVLLRGTIAGAIWPFCIEKDAHLLVVGDSELTRALVESPLDKLAFGGAVPMLVVRDEAPLLIWAHGTAPLQTLLALDRSWTTAMARRWITRMSEYGALDVTAVHIWWPAGEYGRRQLPMPADADFSQVERLVRKEVEVALQSLPSNVTHRVILEIGETEVGAKLLAISSEQKIDVLVVGTHHIHGMFSRLWSVSRGLLGLPPMSLVCVPGAEDPDDVTRKTVMSTSPLIFDHHRA